MGVLLAMPLCRDPELLRRLQEEVDSFLATLRRPVLFENGVELCDLSASDWRMTVERGKLLFEAWNPRRSIARRLESVAGRGRGRLRIFTRKPGSLQPSMLEFRDLGAPESTVPEDIAGRSDPVDRRARFRAELLALLARDGPGWKVERVSNRSDREHSFSAWYTRGVARRNNIAWAFLGLGDSESPAAADAALAYALIWLDWLRGQYESIDSGHTAGRAVISGLKLFLPPEAVPLAAHRAAYLNPRAVQIEIFEWREGQAAARPIDLKDFGNVETRLASCRSARELVLRHREFLRAWLGGNLGDDSRDDFDRLDVVPGRFGNALSLRVLGLEVARIEGEAPPRIAWGLEGNPHALGAEDGEEFRRFLKQVLEIRRPRSPDRAHELYRLQPERWLESLLVRDPARIDPALSPDHVYPQVPAFSGLDRGVIDILGVRRAAFIGHSRQPLGHSRESGNPVDTGTGQQNRLAVIELKVEEHINLPLQALDYWLRVKWLHERGQFRSCGYFPGMELAPDPPLLYLVAPAFRFHSTTDSIIRYFDPSIEVIKVGLNQSWREGIKVLFRRHARIEV